MFFQGPTSFVIQEAELKQFLQPKLHVSNNRVSQILSARVMFRHWLGHVFAALKTWRLSQTSRLPSTKSRSRSGRLQRFQDDIALGCKATAI